MRSAYPHIPDLGPGVFASGPMDEAIKECLPKDAKILSAVDSVDSTWAHTAKIEVELRDGSHKAYFMKAMPDDNGKRTMQGHFECSKAFHNIAPDFTPEPVGWGTLKSDPNMYFFLQDFHKIKHGDYAEIFTKRMAQIHRQTMAMHLEMKAPYEKSGKPKFGFHVPSAMANFAHRQACWEDSWEEWYAKTTRWGLEIEEQVNGPQPDGMKEDLKALFERVIPRVLRPLETGGRQIKPCLMHGDMEYYNFVLDLDTNKVICLDLGCSWGHNELDLRPTFGKTSPGGVSYTEAYLREFGEKSEPVEDFELRGRFYRLRSGLNSAIPGVVERQVFINILKELVETCTETYEEWLEKQRKNSRSQSEGNALEDSVPMTQPPLDTQNSKRPILAAGM